MSTPYRHKPQTREALTANGFGRKANDSGPDFATDPETDLLYPESDRAEQWMDENADEIDVLEMSGGFLADAHVRTLIRNAKLTIAADE